MLKNFFEKKAPAEDINLINPPDMGENLWVRCAGCKGFIYEKQFNENLMVCPKCGHHMRMGAGARIDIVADPGSFKPFNFGAEFKDPISFPGYSEKWDKTREKTGLSEAVVCGEAEIGGCKTVLCVMDSAFFMGSMGSILGEHIARSFEEATVRRLPVVIFTASGGARMQEGIISLMQMAKVTAAQKRHDEAGLLYITVITDPTTGGVTASFASLGDIIIAEEGAVFGFAGRRVIEQTIGKRLPGHFQTSAFALEHGLADIQARRGEIKEILSRLLFMHDKTNDVCNNK